jgi:hypothetical protein
MYRSAARLLVGIEELDHDRLHPFERLAHAVIEGVLPVGPRVSLGARGWHVGWH